MDPVVQELLARVAALEANLYTPTVYETQWGVQRTANIPANRAQVQIQKLSVGAVKPGDIVIASGAYVSSTLPKSQLDPDYTQVTGCLYLSSDPYAITWFDEPTRWSVRVGIIGGPNVIWEMNHFPHAQSGVTLVTREAPEAWLIEVAGSGQGAEVEPGYARISAVVLRKPA